LVGSCVGTALIKHVIEVNIDGRIEVTRRRERRRKQVLDDVMENRKHWNLKGKAIARAVLQGSFSEDQRSDRNTDYVILQLDITVRGGGFVSGRGPMQNGLKGKYDYVYRH